MTVGIAALVGWSGLALFAALLVWFVLRDR